MKTVYFLTSILLVASCSSSKFVQLDEDLKVKILDQIEHDKAMNIMAEFVAQEKRWNFKGIISIEEFGDKYRRDCNRTKDAREVHGKFCSAHYQIWYQSDQYCIGGSRVIESCNLETCAYEISKYTEICE